MTARYLIRLDDACPTMNWDVWDRLEAILLDSGVRPLVAVVPDNRDERLRLGGPRRDFWDRVRAWQARGWTIGLHGYQHRVIATGNGRSGSSKTEFAGLPFAAQAAKINAALDIFHQERVRADAWVAPWHSFDATTVAVLQQAGIRVICDRLALYPYVDDDQMVWIPQQLWWFSGRPWGVWTVCLHPNRWTEGRTAAFARDLDRYAGRITDVQTLLEGHAGRRRDVWDRLFRAKRVARKRVRGLVGPRSARGGTR